jgi:hypothetical protein
MVKWIFLLVVSIIVVSILAYRLFLYAPLYPLDKESMETASIRLNQDSYLSFIVTTEINGGVTMHRIDSLSADRNYSFTQRNFQKN